MTHLSLLHRAAALGLLGLAALATGPASAEPRPAPPNPVTRLSAAVTAGPASPTNATSATLRFAVSGASSTACSLDGAPGAACSSPVTYSGLQGGQHTFSLHAMGKTGTTTAAYSWTIDTTPPTAPSGLTATVSSGQVTLSWHAASDPDGSVAGYYVLRGGVRVGQTTATSFADTGLSNGSAYTYAVAAYDPAGNVSAPSATVSASPSAGPLPLGVPGTWTLKFDDEFNGTSLDLSKWQPNWLGASNRAVTTPDNGSDRNCMDPAQVTEGGGVLNLSAVARTCLAAGGVSYPYASGLVNTDGKFSFTYGYMEARIYLPATAAGVPVNFPAFWANGTGSWPATGELDVMEVLRDCGPGEGFHFHSLLGAFGGCAALSTPAGWHTFGADWQPGSVTYYYDGLPVGRVTSGVTSSPMYLVLNNSVDPTWGGPTQAPADMQVDYVRVWQ